MIDWILELDKKLFLFLNGINSPTWDQIMWWVSYKWTWVPLYAILVFVIVYRERSYRFVYTLIFVALVVVFCDQLSNIFKVLFERYRPCNDNSGIKHLVHLVKNKCGGEYGFFSAHAANSFAVAAYLACIFKSNKFGIFIFLWAAVVAYSRVYLGVHYPLDIIVGALIGALAGFQFYVFRVQIERYISRKLEKRKDKLRTKSKE